METTIIPFGSLPSCATACGHLYDANGACVPPAVTTADAGTYDRCFCSQSVLQPFSTAVSGVCDAACTGNDAAGITSIQKWYSSFCASVDADTTTTGSKATGTKSASEGSGGGDWISNHWRWVIMLVVLVVGITGIWVGACIWRRRYIRRRDQLARGKGPAKAEDAANPNPVYGGHHQPSHPAGSSESAAEAGHATPEPHRKWNPSERT